MRFLLTRYKGICTKFLTPSSENIYSTQSAYASNALLSAHRLGLGMCNCHFPKWLMS